MVFEESYFFLGTFLKSGTLLKSGAGLPPRSASLISRAPKDDTFATIMVFRNRELGFLEFDTYCRAPTMNPCA